MQQAQAGLWLAVVLSGLYHGANPGMGWPLAVSAGLMGRKRRDLLIALVPLAAGHVLAMLIILLPFALASILLLWQPEIRVCGNGLVIAFGIFRLLNRRHPRSLARIRPDQLALWSFAIATAHGAGLMLLPIYFGLCAGALANPAHLAASSLMTQGLLTALLVSVVHALAMVTAGGVFAALVYHWLGLKFLSRYWVDFDFLWAISLIFIGCAGLLVA